MNLYVILGLVLVIVGVTGVLTGKVIAGSKGLKPNYYSRYDSPFLFYLFVAFYISCGSFVLVQSL
ncbi:Uncharacterised protein [BD1-7 clade bacterium]|uniref:Uncharacterized protein n=1 Tax=BD1-7 clade bacterium TaxID=2029982 RepID=A0A5S9QKA0_9GAMM|nr:Uncharacterised protein [BD1-7 clade bacterium]